MNEKSEEAAVANSVPKQHSLYRLVTDQARIDDDVLNYKYDGSGTTEDPYVVTWIPDDAGNPMNWTKSTKWTIAMVAAMECFATAFSSSAFSGCIRELVAHLRVSTTLLTAGISLFVLGFALGPLLWAPLSEIYGRQKIFFVTFLAFTVFEAGATADAGVATLLAMRFLAGSFGSSPFTNAGGVIADIFPANERGLAMGIFSLCPSAGPTLGPLVGGFLGQSRGWRWVMGLMTILAGALWIIGSLLVPETYAPLLLRKRAAELSKRTGQVYKTKIDIEKGEISAAKVLSIALVRPWLLLFVEPIVLILSIWLGIVYGTLYLLFGAFPVVFQLERGWSEGVGGLAFLGVALGMVAAIAMGGVWQKQYNAAAAKNGGVAPPEARLPPTIIGGLAIPIAANTVLRSLFGAAFPLFTRDMYNNLGTQWASSVPAFLALSMVPVPIVLYKYGAVIRSKCVYASEAERAMSSLRAKAAQGPPVSTVTRASLETLSSEETSTIAPTDEKSIVEPIKAPATTRQYVAGDASDPQRLLRTTSRAESLGEAAVYEASPYDIDRVNTNASVAGVDLRRIRTNASQR
ncbi:hypothetical protein LTR05_008082 [Lithohypha guttulata]|uniref:Major facilitator superfamily (MFS) profile domain-containing protein n=1 Tax=Lithohypha guttulata TaxID=1690604 RepID=A0AAN7Y3V2_9EURO|nr:hypothetical protein LTR05_008082 [Lithohypha guttulata]